MLGPFRYESVFSWLKKASNFMLVHKLVVRLALRFLAVVSEADAMS